MTFRSAASAITTVVLLLASSVSAHGVRTGKACGAREFEGSPFTVCTFDSRSQALRLAVARPNGVALRSFDALRQILGPSSDRVRFAMNVGMFEADGRPVGLYIENGKTFAPLRTDDGSGNFFLKPNGVFSIDRSGALHVETTENYQARNPSPAWATQSGPMLVIGGALHPQIQPNGPSQLIRNGVGRLDDHTAVFAISDAPVSFGRLARLFRDNLHCRDALYFDGTISSLWVPSIKRQDSAYKLGPMVLVSDKP